MCGLMFSWRFLHRTVSTACFLDMRQRRSKTVWRSPGPAQLHRVIAWDVAARLQSPCTSCAAQGFSLTRMQLHGMLRSGSSYNEATWEAVLSVDGGDANAKHSDDGDFLLHKVCAPQL